MSSNKGLGSVFLAKFKKEKILGTFLSAEKSEESECISSNKDWAQVMEEI